MDTIDTDRWRDAALRDIELSSLDAGCDDDLMFMCRRRAGKLTADDQRHLAEWADRLRDDFIRPN